MPHVPIGFGLAALLLLAACGDASTDTVEDSRMTAMNGAELIEGTTNDSAMLEGGMNGAMAAEPPPREEDTDENDNAAEPDNAT